MALVKCAECGHDVSTRAKACPNCGCKPPSNARRFTLPEKCMFLLCVLSVATFVWSGSGRSKDKIKEAAVAPSASPSDADTGANESPALPPAHNYVYQDGIEYGYQPALTKEDRDAGTLARPLQMFVFNSQDDQGFYWFKARSLLGGVDTFTCREPCDVMKISSQGPGDYFQQVSMPVAPGSILAAVLQDARNGYLKPVWGSSKRPSAEAQKTPASALGSALPK